ncbi:hypothetical protein QWZ08_19460 [Ferruginibacter paludis]|uniref:hypothetical protein n=1 Tax=Ferruginibacter paludis TaxID=1310417 RepID=UPI0025B55385|nr:hypothetical protein [Ferruginibacter paludis]MDN3657839.1 hypothetical protein [Ferruginibacter paludis]
MKKLILTVALGIALFSLTFAQTSKKEIRSVSVTFNTTSNDKDHDTYLDVYLNYHDYQDNTDYYVAKKNGIGGHWNNGSSNNVTLDMAGKLDLEQHRDALIKLHISPNGNDKWEFDYTVNIVYVDEDGNARTLTKEFKGKILTQDNQDTSDALF